MENILFVNACVRDNSRTLTLARRVLDKLDGAVTELDLIKENIRPLDCDSLLEREKCVEKKDFSSSAFDYAKQFAAADIIVIAAPYWDLSFPATVKCYLETVTVCGISFVYGRHGIPHGLCKAKRIIYVTTAGGVIGDFNFGFIYVKSLAENFYGIPTVQLFMAEGLDIHGTDEDKIMRLAEDEIDSAL